MSALVESTIKVSLIVLFALASTLVLRKRSAAVRHWMLSAAIACAAVAPMLQPFAPTWDAQGILPPAFQRQAQPLGPVSGSTIGREGMSAPAREAELSSSLPWHPALAGLAALMRDPASAGLAGWDPALAGLGLAWMLGSIVSLLVLAMGLGRLAWLASRSTRIGQGRWTELTAEISRAFGLRRPVALLQSDHPTLLVTWGFARPKVVLPAAAREWSDDRMRVVLLHELAHIKRGDWVTQMAAECLRAAYWFNPLVWIASRRLRQESEHACDDAVLNGGVEGTDYATHLLALARSARQHRTTIFGGFPAPAMARPSSLERRFSAMLNTGINRNPVTQPARLATVGGLAVITVLVAGFGAAQTFSTFSGSVFDPTNRVLPGVTLVLTNAQSQAKYEIKTDRTGRFEFVGLPPGDYTWEAALMGFAKLGGTVSVAGRNVQRDVALEVGSLQETISIRAKVGTGATGAETSAPVTRRTAGNVDEIRRQQIAKVVCPNDPIGGNIKAPQKLVDVRPRYPAHLSAGGIGGKVVLDARIGTDGDVVDVSVVTSAHPDLDNAAAEAVRLWQFTSTLLNCIPVEVKMKVTANFATEQ